MEKMVHITIIGQHSPSQCAENSNNYIHCLMMFPQDLTLVLLLQLFSLLGRSYLSQGFTYRLCAVASQIYVSSLDLLTEVQTHAPHCQLDISTSVCNRHLRPSLVKIGSLIFFSQLVLSFSSSHSVNGTTIHLKAFIPKTSRPPFFFFPHTSN